MENQQGKSSNQCGICKGNADAGFRCSACIDYNLCNGCYNKYGHPHKMLKLGWLELDPGFLMNRVDPLQRNERSIQMFSHAENCAGDCNLLACPSTRRLVAHMRTCRWRIYECCLMCKDVAFVYRRHADYCRDVKCPTKYCVVFNHLRPFMQRLQRKFVDCRIVIMRGFSTPNPDNIPHGLLRRSLFLGRRVIQMPVRAMLQDNQGTPSLRVSSPALVVYRPCNIYRTLPIVDSPREPGLDEAPLAAAGPPHTPRERGLDEAPLAAAGPPHTPRERGPDVVPLGAAGPSHTPPETDSDDDTLGAVGPSQPTCEPDLNENSRMPAKKSKDVPKSKEMPKSKEAPKSSGDAARGGDDLSWDLGKNRAVKLTEFKGKWYVDIREFYLGDGGEMKPGRKGIMLTMEQWQKFKSFLPEIDEAVKKNV